MLDFSNSIALLGDLAPVRALVTTVSSRAVSNDNISIFLAVRA